MDSQKFYTGIGLISISLAVHGSVFFSMDKALSFYQSNLVQEQGKLRKEKEGPIQFEFVETPREILSHKSARTKRISDRDALNRDMLKDKIETAVRPKTKIQGHADQLIQTQGSYSREATPQIEPSQGIQEEKKEDRERAIQDVRHSEQVSANKDSHSGISNEAKNLSDNGSSVELQNPVKPKIFHENVISESHPSQPKVEARSEIQGSGGGDKITTQEMSKIKSPGAQLFGQTSFEATGSGMGEYMKNLKEKIWLSWFPYLAYKYPQDFRGADVVVSMVLDARGKVKIVRVVDSVGSEVFASYCLEAIQRASGFGPIPPEILTLVGKDELEIKFGFHYR